MQGNPHGAAHGAPLYTPQFVLLCATTLGFFMSFHLLLPTLPLYALQVGGTEAEVGLIVGFFTATALAVRPFAGRMIDRRGRRGLLLLGLGISGVAGFLYLGVTSMAALLLLRLFHGLGLGIFTTTVSAVATDLAPPPRRGEAMSINGMATSLAMAIAPPLGMALVNAWSFPTLFLASAAIAALAVAVGLAVRETRRPGPPEATAPGGYWSRRAVAPSGVMFALCYSFGRVISFLPLYARQHGMRNPGLLFTWYALTLIAVQTVARTAADRYGRSAVILPGLALVAAAMGLLAVAASSSVLAVAVVLYGAGYGLAQPGLLALTADRVGPEERGRGMATLYVALELGIGSGSVLAGLLLGVAGFPAMFALAAAVALCGMGGQLALAKREALGRRIQSGGINRDPVNRR